MDHRIVLLVSIACAALGAAALAADPPAAAAPAVASATGAPLISQADLLERLGKQDPEVVVLDVRTAEEFAAGHVPGARNVSHDQLPARLEELASLKDKQVVLYCRSGRRSQIAEQTLRAAGFTRLRHLEGDFQGWTAAGRPVEK